ncbi:MAG: tmk [Parcubacteria group bacterium]|nr:tmk [Parcubacteria group bacterium]
MKKRALFIAIEGIDGVGKATQTGLLVEALTAQGKECLRLEFPDYHRNIYGKLLGECLAGKRGDFSHMDPKVASTLYMVDRFESSPAIRQALAAGKVVVSDRFSGSNQIHQGGKVKVEADRIELLNWFDAAEHGLLGNPRPSAVIYLNAPVDVSLQLLQKKRAAKSGNVADGESDQVEKDREYLDNSHAMAEWLAGYYDHWHLIDCTDGAGTMRSREDIHADVMRVVVGLLAAP